MSAQGAIWCLRAIAGARDKGARDKVRAPSRPPPVDKHHPPLSESDRGGLVLVVYLGCGFSHGRALHTDVTVSFLIVLARPGPVCPFLVDKRSRFSGPA